MNLKDLEKMGNAILGKAIDAMDKIDTDKIGEGLGKFAATIEKRATKIQEGYESFVDGAQEFFEEFQDKATQVISDIEDKAIEVAGQEVDDLMDKTESMSQNEEELREKRFEKLLNYFEPRHSEYFTNVIANLINEQLDNKLYMTDDMFVIMIEMMLSQAINEYTEKEDIETIITRKILLIIEYAESKVSTDTKKYLVELQSIIDLNKEEVDKRIIDINIKGHEESLGSLNPYQKEVAKLEAKYLGVLKYIDTLLPFFDLLVNLYKDEREYATEMPFENIAKAFELGILKNEEDYMSILEDPEACSAYVNKFERKIPVEDVKEQSRTEVVLDKKNSSDAYKPISHIVKIYDDYYEMNSFFKNPYVNNPGYMACSLKDESGQREINSEYLVHSKSGNLVTYYIAGAFAEKMNKVINSQSAPIIECNKELFEKYPATNILIVKCKGVYCNLPTMGGIYQYHQDLDLFTMTLADESTISINPLTSDVVKYSEESEIMIDILRQISENQAKKLKQF